MKIHSLVDLLLLLLSRSLLDAEDETLHSELNEQVQIRSVDDATGGQVGRGVVARTGRVVSTAIVVEVKRGADDEGTDNHLRDLEQRDDPRREPLGHHAHGLEEVVEVHHRVHGVVHGHKVQARGGLGDIGVPAVQQHGHVVVPVQEDQRLLAKNDKQGVHQLGNLGQNKQLSGKTRSTVSIGNVTRLAHRLNEWLRGNTVKHVRHSADRAVETEQGEEQVPSRQSTNKTKRLHIGHDLLSEEAEEHVHNDASHGNDVFVVSHGIEQRHRIEALLKITIERLQSGVVVEELYKKIEIGTALACVLSGMLSLQRRAHCSLPACTRRLWHESSFP